MALSAANERREGLASARLLTARGETGWCDERGLTASSEKQRVVAPASARLVA